MQNNVKSGFTLNQAEREQVVDALIGRILVGNNNNDNIILFLEKYSSNLDNSAASVPPSVAPASIASPVPIAPSPVPIAPSPAPIAPSPAPIAPSPAPIAPSPAPIAPSPAPIAPSPAPIAPSPVCASCPPVSVAPNMQQELNNALRTFTEALEDKNEKIKDLVQMLNDANEEIIELKKHNAKIKELLGGIHGII
jgi:hypothetical protein